MVEITDKARCCGCSACASACPVSCIEMVADDEGFLYPVIDVTSCINCGKCELACPFRCEIAKREIAPRCWAMKTTNKGLHLRSSSGGVCSELAKAVLGAGGIVFGVTMNDDCRGCMFCAVEDEHGLESIRGSKYLQAKVGQVYQQVLNELQNRRQVLFFGTPCQCNALRLFLGRDWPNLLLVDFVCHGVPSSSVWAANMDEIEKRFGRRIDSVSFRYKNVEWQDLNPSERLDYVYHPLGESSYMRLYLRDVCLRPSCYACRAKGLDRLADITVADFWGVEYVLPEMADELGCSLVIGRTELGERTIEMLESVVDSCGAKYEDAVRRNCAEFASAMRPPCRDRFYNDLACRGYDGVVELYGRIGFKERLKELVKRQLHGNARILELMGRPSRPMATARFSYGILYRFEG